MPGLFSNDILDEVARANDIVEVVSGYFPLKRAGKDYVALCPFHAEKTPSFTVSPAKQIFKCFGCGRGGSVFNFVMAKESITFPEAVRILAERAGIELREDPDARRKTQGRRRLRDVLTWAQERFQAGLAHPTLGTPGREYLKQRGLADETIKAFGLGFAPEGWDNLIRAGARDGIGLDMLEQAGLVIPRNDGTGYYDRFRGRAIFPIFDALNRPIGFGGRVLGDEEPKYLNSPETPLFHKKEALYGLPQAREAIEADRRAVVVEGYFDVITPWQSGVRTCVATLGTALTDDHIQALKRYADEVVVVFDSDLAGRRAADRAMELFLAHDVRILVAVVPEGKDPCDFCTLHGADGFRQCLAGAADAFKYKWDLVQQDLDAATNPAARERALRAMLESVLKAPALAQQDLRLQRDLILGHMSRTLGIPEATLRAEFRRLRRPAGRSAAGTEVGRNLPDAAHRGRQWVAERKLLTALVCRPSAIEDVLDRVPPERIETPAFRRLYEAIRSSPSAGDADVAGLVRGMEDPADASLAVELFEQGQAMETVRNPADTGPGPIEHLLEEALRDFKKIEEEALLEARRQARGQAPTQGGADPNKALKEFAEARGNEAKKQAFTTPAARKRMSGDSGQA
ncbi:MAG: DNA primase [Planctomycetes bacterium]|nr:DNA primase [Planctomycetota bacterium]